MQNIPGLDISSVNRLIGEYYMAASAVEHIIADGRKQKEARPTRTDIKIVPIKQSEGSEANLYTGLYPENIRVLVSGRGDSRGLSSVVQNAIDNDVYGKKRKKSFLAADFFSDASNSLVLYADSNGAYRNTPGFFGYNRYHNVVAYTDGTTVTQAIDGRKAAIEYNNRIARSIYHKGDFLEVRDIKELDEASEETKLVRGKAGLEKGGIFKVTLNRYGLYEGAANNDYSVIYVSEDKLPDFFSDAKIIGTKNNDRLKLTAIGRKIINDLYTVDSDGKIIPLHKGTYNTALSKYTQSQEYRLKYERIIRAIEKNGYGRVLQADAVQQMVFNIRQSVDVTFLDRFHKAVLSAGTGGSYEELQAVIDELRDSGRIDLNAVNRGLKSPFWIADALEDNQPDLNSAAGWIKIFSNNSGASRLNPSMVDHTFFLARNMEYGSRLAYMARQIENIKGYDEKRIIGGLTNYEILGSMLNNGEKAVKGLASRAKSRRENFYIPLDFISRKKLLRSNENPVKIPGIEFSALPEAAMDNYKKMLDAQSAGNNNLKESIYGQRQLLHNFFMDVLAFNKESGIFAPLFLNAGSDAEKEANKYISDKEAELLRIINGNNSSPETIFTDAQNLLFDTINYRRQLGESLAGANPLVNPASVNTVLLKKADNKFKSQIQRSIAKKNRSIHSIYNLSDFMNPKDRNHLLMDSRLNEIYGPDQALKMQQLFEAQRGGLDKAAIMVTDFIRANGGVLYTTEQGKVYAKFDGRPVRIDDKLPRFVSIGPASYLRIGNSNYIAGFDLDFFRDKNGNLSDTSAFRLKTRVEKAFGKYFMPRTDKNNKDAEPLSIADRMLKRAGQGKNLSKEEQFVAILKHTTDMLMDSQLQGQSPVHDINLNYAVSMKRLMTDEYLKKQLKNLLGIKKSGADDKIAAKIDEVISWIDSGSEYLDVPTKNAISNLIINGIIPNRAKYDNLYMPFSRDLKLTNAATNALYSLFPFGSTGTEMFDSVGRGISFVDSDTIKWAKKHYTQRVAKSRLKKQLLKSPNTIFHQQQLFASTDDIFGETISDVNTVHLEATQKDIDRLAQILDKKLVEKGYSDELRKEISDRFKLRTQIFEGGGSISGRLLSSIGYRQGDNLIDVTNKDLSDDAKWSATGFKLKLDENGKVIGFKYNQGYLVAKGESLLSDYSLYGDAYNETVAKNAAVVRRRLASQGREILEENEVLDIIKTLAGDTGKGITEEDFYRTVGNRLRVVAQVSDIKNTGAVKLLSDVSEKHITQINEDNLSFAAKVSGEGSALDELLKSEEFKEVNKEIIATLGVDLANDRLSYELIDDIASGRFNHEIWAELKARKDANFVFIKNAVKKANKVVEGRTKFKDQIENIYLIPDLIKEITGADVINLEIADSVKHKTNSLLKDTWEGIVTSISKGKNPTQNHYDRALEEIRNVFFGSGSVYEKDGNLVINSFSQESFGYRPEALLELRKKYNLGETISGDYIGSDGKLINAIGKNIESAGRTTSFLLKNSPVQFIHDAYNFLNKPRWGLREQLSLNNDIIYGEGLGKVQERMGISGFRDVFEKIFQGITPTYNGYLTWQAPVYNNQSAGTLLIKHAALWAPRDKAYFAGNSTKTWLDRRKRETYLSILNHKIDGAMAFSNAAIGDKFIEDVTLANEGMTALLIQNEYDIGQKVGDKKLLERLYEKFGVKVEQALAPEDVNTRFEEMFGNILANGETDPSLIWNKNSIVELYKEGDILEEILGPDKRYIAIPASAPKSVIPGSNALAVPTYQRKAARLIDSIVRLRQLDAVRDKELSNEEKLERERLIKGLNQRYDQYVDELKEYFGSKKSAAQYDWLSPQVEFGARMKTQVFDVAQIIAGDAPSEVNRFLFNGKSYKELMQLDNFESISDKVKAFKSAEGKALPSFAIASIYDLDKFGYGDDYFEELGKTLGLKKEDIKADWLKRAQSEGVEIIVNRSPSDYKHSSNVSRLFFSDKFGPGVILTDSITAAKMKNDSDGDTSLAAMLGARSSFAKNYGKWLDINTFSAITRNGTDKNKIALLEKEYGKETIAELLELKKAYDRTYNYDAYYRNFDFLAEGSSLENYEPFLSSGYAKAREKSIVAAQRKYFLERGIAGRIYGFRKNTFSADELKKIDSEWSAAQKAISKVIKNISGSKDEAVKTAEAALLNRIEEIGPTFVSYKKGEMDNLAKLWGKMVSTGNDNEKAVLGSLIISDKEFLGANNILSESAAKVIEQGVKSKTEYLSLITEFALKNNQTGVGEIDPGLFAIDIATNEYARKHTLTEIERSSISYLRESAKEGFLTTKKGEFSITEREKMSGELKDYITGIIKYQGDQKKTEQYTEAVEGLRSLMKTKGLDVIKRNPGFGSMTHGEIIDTAISTLEKTVSVIPKEYRYSPSAASSLYLNPLIEKMFFDQATAMNSASSYWNAARIISFLGFGSIKQVDSDAISALERLGQNIRERTRASRYVVEDKAAADADVRAEEKVQAQVAADEEQIVSPPKNEQEIRTAQSKPVNERIVEQQTQAEVPAIVSAAEPKPKPAIEAKTTQDIQATPISKAKTGSKNESEPQPPPVSSKNSVQDSSESKADNIKPKQNVKKTASAKQPKKTSRKKENQTKGHRLAEKIGAGKLDWIEKTVIPRLGGWNKVALGIAGGIIGAGYVGGNPSSPSGYEAGNYIIQPQKPVYADANVLPDNIGSNQQGYIVNINARADQGYRDTQVQNIIGNAVTSTYSNNTVTINTNMNHRENYMSAQDLYDYLALSL